ncbi:extracellular catalytic domain type 2 short-chain-length polyhydroxyalkanoate depolymerase [Alteromonas gilva]|uniref:PHB depolymerase family esterase n=1 Tax=Alteromonas gilva TaxID=2987522 RepID=A0ABT5L3W1_9ALTE|nr:PHB depolymerase family esterase [Alteromonas gilva]MDC8831721.1 PHB depolymerase family esterase [Alteromonas gilva]
MKQTAKCTIAASLVMLAGSASASDDAPSLQLDTRAITVSGLSSGGYMATQFHLANSDKVVGAAMLASGPYYCAQNNIATALGQCVDKVNPPIDVKALSAKAEELATAGKIPALDNLRGDKVWLLHGNADTRVNQAVSDALYQQYKQWIPAAQLTYVNDKAFAHVFPTEAEGGSCLDSAAPYIGKCGYDAAGTLLTALLGELNAPDDVITGEVIGFDQHAIAGDNASTLAEEGYAFIPQSCSEGAQCRVHVSFHGCNQYADAVDMAYVEKTGLNRWADDNNLVVVYPQTRKSLIMPMNPQGCWDWWGYTSAAYVTSEGPQIKAVNAFIDFLATR